MFRLSGGALGSGAAVVALALLLPACGDLPPPPPSDTLTEQPFLEMVDSRKPRPAPNTDAFGVAMLYPSKVGGETWTLAKDPTLDVRFDPQGFISRNPDGSWKMRNTQVRMQVYTSQGYDASAITSYQPGELAQRGYMQAPNDWKNVEITGYVKVNSTLSAAENFSWYARGGRHTDQAPCEGTSYKGALHYDGTVRWMKESWHVSYANSPLTQGASRPLYGRWVGFKAVMRNTLVDGRTAVRLELWLDDDADRLQWTKVYDMVDAGAWGGDTTRCGGAVDGLPLTWGGPITTFRWDGADDVDFKWLSVREIQ
jgi:hypothetical protein